jgi:hypothetical protein
MRLRKSQAAVLLLLLIVSLNAVYMPDAYAPPVPYGYTCGLISEYQSTDVRVSNVSLNVAIIVDSDGEDLTYKTEISSSYKLTNTADHEASFLTSYVRSPWIPFIEYQSIPDNVSILGEFALYNASVVYNISTRGELPEDLRYRFPSGFFSSFFNLQIAVVNITMAAQADVVLSVSTVIEGPGGNFDFRYGLDMNQLAADSTQLDGIVDVSNTPLLIRTTFLNSHSRSVIQGDDSLVARWSISDWDWSGETTYPGLQFDDDVFSDYIGVQLVQSEYRPPGPDWVNMTPLIMVGIIPLVILLAVWARWATR